MHLSCREMCDRAVKVLLKNFYVYIGSIIYSYELSLNMLKFCLTLDQLDKEMEWLDC